MSALVEAGSPDEAAMIAREHRKAKRLWGAKTPASLDDDNYAAEVASEIDIAWCRKLGVGIQTGLPVKPQEGAASARKSVRAIRVPEHAERAARAVSQAA